MAGWTTHDSKTTCWKGTICATDGFEGDGSKLTGVAGSGGSQWISGTTWIQPTIGSLIISAA